MAIRIMKHAIAAGLLCCATAAQAQGFVQGYLGAQQQYLQNQLLQQQLEQQRQQMQPQFHTYQFPNGSLNCMTMLQGTPAATTTCR